jgi:hypothetical protein
MSRPYAGAAKAQIDALFSGMKIKPAAPPKPRRRVTLREVFRVAWVAWRRARAMTREELQIAEANAAFDLQAVADEVLVPATKRLLANVGGDLYEIGDARTDQARGDK